MVARGEVFVRELVAIALPALNAARPLGFPGARPAGRCDAWPPALDRRCRCCLRHDAVHGLGPGPRRGGHGIRELQPGDSRSHRSAHGHARRDRGPVRGRGADRRHRRSRSWLTRGHSTGARAASSLGIRTAAEMAPEHPFEGPSRRARCPTWLPGGGTGTKGGPTPRASIRRTTRRREVQRCADAQPSRGLRSGCGVDGVICSRGLCARR